MDSNILLQLLPYLMQGGVNPRVGGRILPGSTSRPQPQQQQPEQPAPPQDPEDAYREMFPEGYYRDLFGVHGMGDPGGGDLPQWPQWTTPSFTPSPTGPGPGTIDWRKLLGLRI